MLPPRLAVPVVFKSSPASATDEPTAPPRVIVPPPVEIARVSSTSPVPSIVPVIEKLPSAPSAPLPAASLPWVLNIRVELSESTRSVSNVIFAPSPPFPLAFSAPPVAVKLPESVVVSAVSDIAPAAPPTTSPVPPAAPPVVIIAPPTKSAPEAIVTVPAALPPELFASAPPVVVMVPT